MMMLEVCWLLGSADTRAGALLAGAAGGGVWRQVQSSGAGPHLASDGQWRSPSSARAVPLFELCLYLYLNLLCLYLHLNWLSLYLHLRGQACDGKGNEERACF